MRNEDMKQSEARQGIALARFLAGIFAVSAYAIFHPGPSILDRLVAALLAGAAAAFHGAANGSAPPSEREE